MSVTVKVFVLEKYWPSVKDTLAVKWQERSEDLIAMLIAGIGEYPIDAVPVEVCECWLNTLRAKYKSPVTPNRALTWAKQIFSAALRWKYCSENPFQGLKKKKEPRRKFHPPTVEQHTLLVNEASEKLRWYVVFARYTGGRLRSLAELEERDVNVPAWLLTFRDSKNGEDYVVPIHPELRSWAVKALTGNPNRRLLPQYADTHSVSQLFRRLRKRVGVEGFRFHDFRHNMGTKLAESGYGVKDIMSMLGHKSEKMSLHYTHVTQERLRKALAESI